MTIIDVSSVPNRARMLPAVQARIQAKADELRRRNTAPPPPSKRLWFWMLPDPEPPAVKIVVPSEVRGIQDIVSKHYGISVKDICSPRRSDYIVLPRHVAIYLCREATDLSLTYIGKRFGGRDHATIKHAANKMAARVAVDAVFRATIENLKAQIERGERP